MVLMNEQNDFIRNIIANTSKSLYIKGAIINSTLYLFALNGILFEIDLTGKIDPSIICGFDSDIINQNSEYILDDRNIFYEVYKRYELISNIRNNPIIFMNENLRDDPQFEQIVTAKSSDGASNYFIITDNGINTFMTLYKGIFNLNKPDKASLFIYSIAEEPNKLLAQFTIFKKKINMNYNICFLFMNFIQRRIL